MAMASWNVHGGCPMAPMAMDYRGNSLWPCGRFPIQRDETRRVSKSWWLIAVNSGYWDTEISRLCMACHNHNLVGGWPTPLKNISQWERLPHILWENMFETTDQPVIHLYTWQVFQFHPSDNFSITVISNNQRNQAIALELRKILISHLILLVGW